MATIVFFCSGYHGHMVRSLVALQPTQTCCAFGVVETRTDCLVASFQKIFVRESAICAAKERRWALPFWEKRSLSRVSLAVPGIKHHSHVFALLLEHTASGCISKLRKKMKFSNLLKKYPHPRKIYPCPCNTFLICLVIASVFLFFLLFFAVCLFSSLFASFLCFLLVFSFFCYFVL